MLEEYAKGKGRHDRRRNEFHPVFILRQGGLNRVKEADNGLTTEVKRSWREFLPGVNGFEPCASVGLRR